MYRRLAHAVPPRHLLPRGLGTHFTCFTTTKVQILTQKGAMQAGVAGVGHQTLRYLPQFTWLYWYKSTNSDGVVPRWQGLVAFAAATGVMPLDMPESVLVRFTGKMQPGITLRDLVHAIPYQAIQMGLLTVEKKGKKNIFSGRILEIEGLGHLKCEQVLH